MVEVELHGGVRGGQHPPRGLMAPCGNQSARADQKDLKKLFHVLHLYMSAALRDISVVTQRKITVKVYP